MKFKPQNKDFAIHFLGEESYNPSIQFVTAVMDGTDLSLEEGIKRCKESAKKLLKQLT